MSVIEEAKKLISVPSVTKNEAEVGRYLAERCRALGCRTELIPVDGDRANVLAVLEGRESDGTLGILFHGHMDTIAPYTMDEPFSPEIRDNHLWGRGSVDQKGGIAASEVWL